MLKNLIDVNDLNKVEVKTIWSLVENAVHKKINGTVAWSFEGNGIRTRSSFIKAFQMLRLNYIELPNLLKTYERTEDLAGYLDHFFDAYIIRESDHDKLSAFAECSEHPVVNAMSNKAHPCEVITDAYFINKNIKPIESANILLWGPPTNVFNSWHSLAEVMDIKIYHICPDEFQINNSNIEYVNQHFDKADVIITDRWPEKFNNTVFTLSKELYSNLGEPFLLPTPPFTIGKEILFDPVKAQKFVGYKQKKLLLYIQSAILLFFLKN